jgi:hypothetical protein
MPERMWDQRVHKTAIGDELGRMVARGAIW